MAKKAKGNRVQVILECTEQKESGVPGRLSTQCYQSAREIAEPFKGSNAKTLTYAGYSASLTSVEWYSGGACGKC